MPEKTGHCKGIRVTGMKKADINTFKLIVFTALLGAFAGLVIWCFLKAVAVCTGFLWEALPEKTGLSFLPVIFCTLGGLLTGILHKRFGDYPEELKTVMGRIQKDKYYDYRPMPALIMCAFLPLICGASVGPEAGLTGIIAALCYWVGDNVTMAKRDIELFSRVGEAVTLSQIFHSPLFGILAVESGEDDRESISMSGGNKLLLYGISTAAALLTAQALNTLFGAAMEGFPSFSRTPSETWDYLMLLLYIPAGLILYVLFELCEKLTGGIAGRIPVVIREMFCGAVIGLIGILIPMAAFSGEEQMGELMETFVSYSPFFLLGICLIKIFMTTFCINLGMKGGHFFPLIFACTCLGFALSSLIFPADPMPHSAFAAAAVTGTVLGAQLKKPLAATLLLLLCFPAGSLFWIFLCAVIGKSAEKKLSAHIHNPG